MLLGLNDLKLKPPLPGEARPETMSARKTPTSITDRASSTFTESETPNIVNTVTTATQRAGR